MCIKVGYHNSFWDAWRNIYSMNLCNIQYRFNRKLTNNVTERNICVNKISRIVITWTDVFTMNNEPERIIGTSSVALHNIWFNNIVL